MDKKPKKYWVILVYLILALATLTGFWQVRSNDFITTFDDDLYILDNSFVKAGLTRGGVIWAVTREHAYNWHPLTWISHMVDCELYGIEPGGHHFMNLLFHVANALLLLWVLSRMTGNFWASAFVAAAFALHPLHVESVAWASERKDTLSTFFWLLTMLAYVRYVERPTAIRYMPVFLFLGLGLLAKQMLVTLPVILLLLDYWPLKRFSLQKQGLEKPAGTIPAASIWRCILEKLPLLFLCALAAAAVYIVQQRTGTVKTFGEYPPLWRIANAMVAYVTYILKMLWPSGLSIFYPHRLNKLPLWQVIGSALVLMCITALVLWKIRRRRYLVVGWLWYVITLVPVIGLIQIGLQAYADRYTYMPLTGLFIIIGWGLADIFERASWRKAVLSTAAVVVLLGLAVMTQLQVRHWQNDITLYTHAAKAVRDNWWAHNVLGKAYAKQDNLVDAIKQYNKALEVEPEYPAAHSNLGMALMRQGKTDEAIEHYTEALRIKPTLAEVHLNFGNIYARRNELDKAVECYSEAVRLKPDLANARNYLGNVLLKQDKFEQAAEQFSKELAISPNSPSVYNKLGLALLWQEKVSEAIEQFNKALSIEPELDQANFNLATALIKQNRLDEAAGHLKKALQVTPQWPAARSHLGDIYYKQQKLDLALRQYTDALMLKPSLIEARINQARIFAELGKIQPAINSYHQVLRAETNHIEALNELAWILACTKDANLRNSAEAVEYAKGACELTVNNQPAMLDTLAAAHAAAGNFPKAVKTAQKAIELAESADKKELTQKIQTRLQLYQANQVYIGNR